VLKESILKLLKLDGLIDNITGYVEARIELMRLEIKEDISKALAKLTLFIVLAFVFTLFVLLISMAVAFRIGEHLGNFGGFAAVAGFYFLLIVILLIFRETIGNALERKLGELMRQREKNK